MVGAVILASGAVGVSTASACVPPFPVAATYVFANDPTLPGPQLPGQFQVVGSGDLQMQDNYCNATTYTIMNTKVCGFFGCSYEDWAESPHIQAGTGDNWTTVQLQCRPGTNRYWTEQVEILPGTPANPQDAWSPGQPEFTC